MKENDYIVCPNCKGKGHVLDGMTALGMNILSIFLIPLERNDASGITRTTCERCNGKGYVKIK